MGEYLHASIIVKSFDLGYQPIINTEIIITTTLTLEKFRHFLGYIYVATEYL